MGLGMEKAWKYVHVFTLYFLELQFPTPNTSDGNEISFSMTNIKVRPTNGEESGCMIMLRTGGLLDIEGK